MRSSLHSLLCIIMMAMFFFAPTAFAGDGSNIYWVHPSGSASWLTCESQTDPSSNYCALSTATSIVEAGDTVYMKGGTYTDQLYLKGKNGTLANRITFVAAPGEFPIAKPTTQYGFTLGLQNSDYIVIDGITFEWDDSINYLMYLWEGSSYIEIANCTFEGYNNENSRIHWRAANNDAVNNAVTNVWMHDCTIANSGDLNNGCSDDNGMQVGGEGWAQADIYSGNHTIEDCIFYGGGHHNLETYTRYNVIRNNVFHNEGIADQEGCSCVVSARTGKYGNRNVQFLGLNGDITRNLIEGNRFGHAAVPSDGNQEGNLTLSGPAMIVRYNKSFYSEQTGIYFKYWADDNLVYNNTFYLNGQDSLAANCDGQDWRYAAMEVCAGDNCQNNILKNNIFYQNYALTCFKHTQIFENNFCTNAATGCTNTGDPLFTNTDVSDPTSTTLPTLEIASNSPAIDGGTYLTQANGSGSSSTTLVVDNSTYFQCGSSCSTTPMGSSLSNVQADWIAIGTVSNVVQISDINHSTNTITLASAMTWSDNANIWLYKKSDGEIVLHGSAPDQGAHEFGGETLSPPVRSGGSPTGTLPSGTTSTTLSLTTN